MVLGKVDTHNQENEIGLSRKLNENAHDIGLANNFRAPKSQKTKWKVNKQDYTKLKKLLHNPRNRGKWELMSIQATEQKDS